MKENSKKLKISKIDVLVMLTVVYGTVCVCMNMYSVKPLSFGLDFILMDAGLLISWIPYLVSSIITECYGKNEAKKITVFTAIVGFCLLFYDCKNG